MRKMYVKIKDCIGGRLRGLCDRLTPRQRAIAVIVMASREVIRIEPLDIPEFVPADSLSEGRIREMEEFFNQFNK